MFTPYFLMVFDLHGLGFPLLWTTPMSKRFWLLLKGATSISGPTVFFWICFDPLGQPFLVDSHCLDMGLEILPKKTPLCSRKKTGSFPLYPWSMHGIFNKTNKKSNHSWIGKYTVRPIGILWNTQKSLGQSLESSLIPEQPLWIDHVFLFLFM